MKHILFNNCFQLDASNWHLALQICNLNLSNLFYSKGMFFTGQVGNTLSLTRVTIVKAETWRQKTAGYGKLNKKLLSMIDF